jgi:hypothetical protein
MTRTLSFVIALAGAALVVAAPAFGKPVPGPGAGVGPMEARSDALEQQGAIVPDAFERAVQAHVLSADRVGPMAPRSNGLHEYFSSTPSGDTRVGPIGPAETRSDGLHEYFSSTPSVDTGVGPMLTRSDGLHWYWAGKSTQAAIAPDAFDWAVQAHASSTPSGDGFLAGDDHVRLDPSQLPTVVVASSPSGDEFEWPQIGIGFLVGILLALGIGLTVRYSGDRPLAH